MTSQNPSPGSMYRTPEKEFPIMWNQILKCPGKAHEIISEILGIRSGCRFAEVIKAATDVVAICPHFSRNPVNILHWRLTFVMPGGISIMFHRPSNHDRCDDLPLPEQYSRLIRDLGIVRFDRFFGVLLDPKAIAKTQSELRLECDRQVVPFFAHETGDYELWLGQEFTKAYLYDHESKSLTLSCQGDFDHWLALHTASMIQNHGG